VSLWAPSFSQYFRFTSALIPSEGGRVLPTMAGFPRKRLGLICLALVFLPRAQGHTLFTQEVRDVSFLPHLQSKITLISASVNLRVFSLHRRVERQLTPVTLSLSLPQDRPVSVSPLSTPVSLPSAFARGRHHSPERSSLFFLQTVLPDFFLFPLVFESSSRPAVEIRFTTPFPGTLFSVFFFHNASRFRFSSHNLS